MSKNRHHEIYDQYMELIKVATDNQTFTDNILDLLHTQGKILGLSHEEMVALETGEGCLSVNREVDGHVPRYARVTIEGYDVDGNKIRIRAREELAIAFQHEIDHLDGILFYDRINKKKPFFSEGEIRLI